MSIYSRTSAPTFRYHLALDRLMVLSKVEKPIFLMSFALAVHDLCACYTGRHGSIRTAIGDLTVADYTHFLKKRCDDPEYELPKGIIIYGTNTAETGPDGFSGTG